MEEKNNEDLKEIEKIIKCKVKLNKQFFPKDKAIGNGDFGIISAEVLDTISGEPEANKWNCISLKGVMCEITYDNIYIVTAKEVDNGQYGKQYEIIFMRTDLHLDSKQDQFTFLSTILPEKQCIELFKTYETPVDLLEKKDIQSLCKVKGIQVPTALKMLEKYEASKDYSEAYIKLDKHGMTKNTINKLVDFYGSPNIVIDKIKKNPYILIDEVDGIGWNKADEMAINSGIGEFSLCRVKAYVKYYLKEEANNGNSWVYIDDLLESIDGVIGYDLPQDILTDCLHELIDEKIIWSNDDRDVVALLKYYNLELHIAEEIHRINTSDNNFEFDNWEEKVHNQEKRQNWEFTSEQIDGIKAILENQITLIIGGAGVGKSSTVAGMLEVFQGKYTFAQTALSGRASCNLSEITKEEGYTIHRLLGYQPETGFLYNKQNPLPKDIIIVDELSMVGEDIFYKLIQAINNGSKLIMLGDTGQLETIGVGNIMKDIIDSECVKIVELTKIHRQAQRSAIITESQKVRHDEQLTDKDMDGVEIRGELQDLTLDIYSNKDLTHDKIIKHFEEIYSIVKDVFDIQVIVPMKDRGQASAYYLNNDIQPLVIPENRKALEVGSESKNPFKLHIGDKVINLKNNYKTINDMGVETPIFNGDLGIITDIDFMYQTITVDFNNKGVVYIPKKHLKYIQLGYAITCHKLQGSGMKHVICGLDYSHYKLLTNEMVYTMLTRAKETCVLCAENKALRYAIVNSNIPSKQTFLRDFLIKLF